jgi:hypothetical protein
LVLIEEIKSKSAFISAVDASGVAVAGGRAADARAAESESTG